MKMQFNKIGKIVAAGTLAGLMLGSTVGFAALDSYPAPFVTSTGGVQSLIVVGSGVAGMDPAGLASDVAGAIDIAARLGGEVTTDVVVAGAISAGSVVGEGKAIASRTTNIFLGDNLGKTGLKSTLTKDDMPTLLAKGSFSDSVGTHKYDQYIDLTPGATNPNNVLLQFDKPSSSSSDDPTYNFGRFTTSPSTTEYMYRTRIVFDVGIDGNATSKSINIFGNDYTISADSTAWFAGTSADKVVLFGGADVKTLRGGESVDVTIGGTPYTVTLIGVQSDGKAVVQVGSTTETIAKSSTSSNFGDLKIYVKESASLSTTDQTQNIATLLVGADKITLQDSSKVKKGTNDDTVDGTYVKLTTSSNKLNQIAIYFGGTTSTNDYIKVGGATYTNPVFKTFGVSFPSVSPDVGGTLDDKLSFRNSGDNNLQMTMTDFNGNTATVNYGYKSSSGGQVITLNDTSGNAIHVVEGETVARDQYLVLDAGGFPHMFKASSVSLDGTSSASIDLQDVFTGTTTKITTGTDNNETAYIDGQAYHFLNKSSTSFAVYWGAGSDVTGVGTFQTIFPTLKTQRDALVAFTLPGIALTNNTKIQLPSGAVTIWFTADTTTTGNWTLTAAAKEDGTASIATAISTCATGTPTSCVFSLGRTATGAVSYNATKTAQGAYTITMVGDTGTETQPGVLIWEEKDDAGNQAGVYVPAKVGTSGSNYLSGIDTVEFPGTDSGSTTWGSNSNKASTIDYWGTLAVRDTATSAQPTVDVWYPDLQRTANIYVLDSDATVSSASGTSAGTVKQAVPIKTSIAKLDTEVTSADKTTKNLILVGGPAVNKLVADLGAAGKTWARADYVTAGAGTAIINLVADAFTTGKSALVVAGYDAADTRFAASVLQQYDSHKTELTGKTLAVYKSNVLSSSLSA